MKKIILILILSDLLSYNALAQGSSTDRKDLYDLLETRRKKFEAYSNSLEKKSGFFGNKTKKDIQHSTDVLSEIVETDNRIISSLNHVIDFRNFEKVNTTYNKFESDERLTNLQRATDTLTKQVDALAISNVALKSRAGKLKWLAYLLSFGLVWALLSLRKRKSVSSQ